MQNIRNSRRKSARRRRLLRSEDRIAKLEKRKKEIDDLLMKPENATNMELVTEYTSLMQKLDEENDNWLLLSEKLEEVSKS